MRPVVLSRRRALAATIATVVSRPAFAAHVQEPLFRIERSKNANIVRYDAVLESPTKLVPKQPIVAYWVLYAEDGRREGLSALDRRAYGFKVAREKESSWLLYMNATRDRSIRVLRWGGRWLAQIVIAGRSAILERMYVATDESVLIPRVRYIDLFGKDMVTKKPLRERLRP